MNQQASDLPRSVRILGRFKILIGFLAGLGLIAGAVFGALNPPASSSEAMLVFAAPSCPQGAICGGPMFSPGYVEAQLAGTLPAGVQIRVVKGNVLSVTVTGQTAAVGQALANAAANAYIADTVSLSYLGDHPSAKLTQSATTASAPISPKRLFDDALLGAVCGLLVGVIAALAGGQTMIDPVTLPRGPGVGAGGGRASGAGRGTGYGSTRFSLEQLAADYAKPGDDDRGRPADMSEAFSPFPDQTEGWRVN
jgi:hypothetical protein